MLAQRRRRWANVGPALGQCLMLAGQCLIVRSVLFENIYLGFYAFTQ